MSQPEEKLLQPYGCTNLRMTEMPLSAGETGQTIPAVRPDRGQVFLQLYCNQIIEKESLLATERTVTRNHKKIESFAWHSSILFLI